MRHYTRFIMAVAGLVCAAAGCVMPKDVPNTMLSRYQRDLVAKGPQQRPDAEGLGLLGPKAGTTGPVFAVYKDPSGGRTQVYLSLDQAIMRCLANNPQIRTVGYQPAIAREQVIQAAAAFDYTVF